MQLKSLTRVIEEQIAKYFFFPILFLMSIFFLSSIVYNFQKIQREDFQYLETIRKPLINSISTFQAQETQSFLKSISEHRKWLSAYLISDEGIVLSVFPMEKQSQLGLNFKGSCKNQLLLDEKNNQLIKICYERSFLSMIDITAILLFTSFLIFLILIKIFHNKILSKINFFLERLSLVVSSLERANSSGESPVFLEEQKIIESIQKYLILTDEVNVGKIKNEKLNAKIEIATQVSHDIRSPLAALKMAIADIDNVPNDYRSMIKNSIQRINDIANNLLNSNRDGVQSLNKELQLMDELLYLVIDSLVSEKRVEYRNRNNIYIKFVFNADRKSFVKINKLEFQRLLSNLINNSIESMESGGHVEIIVDEADDKKISVRIIDTGIGIPEHVLSKLGDQGVTYGKNGNHSGSGSGLGIYHAKSTLLSLDGSFQISSQENVGTVISMQLPKIPAPPWFGDELIISNESKIFVLDDEVGIHQMWNKKLGLITNSFTSIDKFSAAVERERIEDILCLIDYDLSDEKITGLEIIESLRLKSVSFLVTSRFEENEIFEQCLKSNIRVIPKSLIECISVKRRHLDENHVFYDSVYIDDDEMLRLAWGHVARKKKINLLLLKSIGEFSNHREKIDKENTKIYIDSHFPNEDIKGEDFAVTLHSEGYRQLFIASGYDADHFAHLPWLNYSGKKCPF